MKELSAGYVSRIEALSGERAEIMQALSDVREEYTVLMSNLPVGYGRRYKKMHN